jgi:hypothetical protein
MHRAQPGKVCGECLLLTVDTRISIMPDPRDPLLAPKACLQQRVPHVGEDMQTCAFLYAPAHTHTDTHTHTHTRTRTHSHACAHMQRHERTHTG